MDDVELTEDDRRNGWDKNSLAQYHREQEEHSQKLINPHRPKPPPTVQNNHYNPLRWR